MDAQELIAYLTDGLDPESAASVTQALSKDAIKAKAATLKAQKEFEQMEQQRAALEAELVGKGGTEWGARQYAAWVKENKAEIERLANTEQAYIAKYGTLNAPKGGYPSVTENDPPQTVGLTPEQIKLMIQQETDARIRDGYSPRWSSLLTGVGDVVQRHMFAGRKEPIDFKKLEEYAGKYNGDLNRAYEDYDKPERDKELAAKQEAEINRRVAEEIQKRGAQQYFPAGADSTPGVLSGHREGGDKFDRGAMERELVQAAISGEYPGASKGSNKGASGFFN